MLQNRFSVTADRTHLALGLTAAPAIQCSGQLLVEAAQVAVFADQAVAEAAVCRFREHRRGAAAALCHQIRQLPHAHAVEIFPDQQHVAPALAAVGHGPEDLLLQLGDAPLLALQQLVHLSGGLAGLQDLCGESAADLSVLLMAPGQEIEGPLAAEHLDPDALAEFHQGEELDEADLAGARHMETAAGAAVYARDLNDPHGPGQGALGPVEDIRQLLGAGGPDVVIYSPISLFN